MGGSYQCMERERERERNSYVYLSSLQMLTGYADLAFQFGLADENQAEYINSEMQAAAQLIADGKYMEADLVLY